MPSDNVQIEAFNEQKRLITMAMKYTGGDHEKARLMAAGKYNDVIVIKGKFYIESASVAGVFIIFLNMVTRRVLNINAIVLQYSAPVDRMRIFDNWRTFYNDFGQLAKKEGERASGSYEVSRHIADSLEGYDIFSFVESSDLRITTSTIAEILGKFYNNPRIQCQIELDRTNSLTLELDGIPIEDTSSPELSDTEDVTDEEKQIAEIEKQADFVINGKLIVSPVRGKYINDVKPGENLKLLFVDKDELSVKVAKTLNSYTEEGEFLPVKGRIKEKFPIESGGYIIYAFVARNVLAKIVEEENVKIEMDSPSQEEKEEKGDSKLILYITLLLGLVLFSLIIILALI
jgi:hypothetical protein